MNAATYFAKTYFAPTYFAVRPAQFNANWYTYEASGGIWLGGAAEVSRARAFHYDGVGGIWLDGKAGLIYGKVYSGAGGIEIAGEALTGKWRNFVYDASGGIWLTGAAALARGKGYTGSGAIWIGGAAESELIPAIPFPLLIKAVIIGSRVGAIRWENSGAGLTVEGVGARAEMLGRQLLSRSITASGLEAMIQGWLQIEATLKGQGAKSEISGRGAKAIFN